VGANTSRLQVSLCPNKGVGRNEQEEKGKEEKKKG
jgi:hypothetical protein